MPAHQRESLHLARRDKVFSERNRNHPMIPIKTAFCPNCKRETTQVKGRCKWCEAKPLTNRPLKNKTITNDYIEWKSTSYLYECSGCGAPFRYPYQLKRHKPHCRLL